MKSGIYIIKNLVNGKIYVGSTKNFHVRKLDHFSALRRKKHYNPKLQRSWNKFGENNFVFEIIVNCPNHYLIKLERWFINFYKPFYNIGIPLESGGHALPEESRIKLREIARNRVYTTERIKNVREGCLKSDKWKEGHKSRAKKLGFSVIIYKGENLIGRFDSVGEASRKLNIRHSSLMRCVNKGYPYKGDYFIKYIEKENFVRVDKRFVNCSLFDLEGNLIKSFDTHKFIADYLEIHPSTILRSISNKEGVLLGKYKVVVDRRRYKKQC